MFPVLGMLSSPVHFSLLSFFQHGVFYLCKFLQSCIPLLFLSAADLAGFVKLSSSSPIIILTKQQLCLWFLLPCPLWDCWGVKSFSAERELKRLAGWCPSPLWWFLTCASSPLKLPGLSALKTSIKYILQPWEESPTSQRAMDLKINADFPCRVAWGKVQARNSIHWGNQQEKKLNQ